MISTENECVNVTEKRVRKSIQRLSEVYDKDFEAIQERKPLVFVGSGINIGDIERVKDAFHRSKMDKETSKNIHMLCYKTVGQANKRNASIKKFNGFNKDDDIEIMKRVGIAERIKLDNLKLICDLFNIPTTGKQKKDISTMLVDYLKCPIETGSKTFRTSALRPRTKSKSSKNKEKKAKIEEKNTKSKEQKAKKTTKKEDVSDDIDMEESENASKADSLSDIDYEEIVTHKKKVVKDSKKTTTNKSNGMKVTPKKKKNLKIEANGNTKEVKKYDTKEDQGNDDDECMEEESVDDTHHKYDMSDTNFMAKIVEILKGADLNSTTLNQVCDKVTAQFPDVDLIAQRHHIKQLVKKVIDHS